MERAKHSEEKTNSELAMAVDRMPVEHLTVTMAEKVKEESRFDGAQTADELLQGMQKV